MDQSVMQSAEEHEVGYVFPDLAVLPIDGSALIPHGNVAFFRVDSGNLGWSSPSRDIFGRLIEP
jgi:hypothetical protein